MSVRPAYSTQLEGKVRSLEAGLEKTKQELDKQYSERARIKYISHCAHHPH